MSAPDVSARGPAANGAAPDVSARGPAAAAGVRRCGVLGSPVAHSLSPVLHRAAHRAHGLDGWTYDAIECDEAALPALVRGLGPEWAGLSVTMPGKRAALDVASSASAAAIAVGAANTLVPLASGGWHADQTDVDGVLGALAAVGVTAARSVVVLGAGGTATAAIVAAARLGAAGVTVVARSAARASDAVTCAGRAGLAAEVVAWDAVPSLRADVLVSTVPAGVDVTPAADVAPVALDVVYHPWPTPLASAVAAAGGAFATGLDMLLHQAFGQTHLFTGREAPREAMRDALRAAVGERFGDAPPLPL